MEHLRGLALKGWAQTLLLASCLLVLSSQLVPPAYAQSNETLESNAHASNQSVTLSGDDRSREGYFQLQVDGLSDGQPFIIELASSAAFDTIEATFAPLGSFRQLSLSGFDDGTYYFRARVEQGEGDPVYSNTHQLTVQHYPLWQALGLFTLGALLFIALVSTLLGLHWRNKRKDHSKHSENPNG